jgi:hypothetical protein
MHYSLKCNTHIYIYMFRPYMAIIRYISILTKQFTVYVIFNTYMMMAMYGRNIS